MSDKGGQHVGPSVGTLARLKQENRDLEAEIDRLRGDLEERTKDHDECYEELIAAKQHLEIEASAKSETVEGDAVAGTVNLKCACGRELSMDLPGDVIEKLAAQIEEEN